MNKVFVLVLSDRTGNEVLNVYTTEQKAIDAIEEFKKLLPSGAIKFSISYLERELI